MHSARTAPAEKPGSLAAAAATQPAMHSITASSHTCGHCSAHSGCGVSGW